MQFRNSHQHLPHSQSEILQTDQQSSGFVTLSDYNATGILHGIHQVASGTLGAQDSAGNVREALKLKGAAP